MTWPNRKMQSPAKLIALCPGPDCITCTNSITVLNTSYSVSRIDPQHLHPARVFFQIPQRLTHLPIVTSENVHKEHVFPGLSPDRTRLNLGKVKVSQGKHAQRVEEGARLVLEGECQRRLIGPCGHHLLLSHQENAGEVLLW